MAEIPSKRMRKEEVTENGDVSGANALPADKPPPNNPDGGEGVEDGWGVPGEKAKLTHEKVDTRSTKNIKMKQHLCVKHALPKTRLTNAILYENVSHDRHLEMKLAGLQHDKHRSSFTMDLNKRAFIAQQDRKRHKWRRDDEVRIAGMNLPAYPSPSASKPSSHVAGRAQKEVVRRPSMETIYHMSGADDRGDSAEGGRKPLLPMMKKEVVRLPSMETIYHMSGADDRGDSAEGGRKPLLPMMKPSSHVPGRAQKEVVRRPSMETIYHMSGADDRGDSAEGGRKPLLPMMKVRRERTEIVSHHDKVFVTKLPSVVEVDQRKLNVHNLYCGKTLMGCGMPSRDDRFRRLHTSLSQAILKGDEEHPAENTTTKSRLTKYTTVSPSASEPLPYRPEARVMVASRGKPNAQGLDMSVSSAPGRERTRHVDYVTERKTAPKNMGKDILELFKSRDIKTLARSLTTDATGMRLGNKAALRAVETERSSTRPRPQNVFVPVVDLFYKVKTGS